MKSNILLVRNFKLVPRPLDEGLRPRQFKLWFSLHGMILEGKLIGLDKIKELSCLESQSVSYVKGCSFFCFFSFPLFFFTFVTFVVQILWGWQTCYGLRTFVESTSTPPYLTNSRIDMVHFVNPHNVVARKNTISTFPSARNRSELEGETESGGLKLQCCPIATLVTMQSLVQPFNAWP